jgi:hypothetical protein
MSLARQISEEDLGLAVVFGLPGPRTRTAVEMLQTLTEGTLHECVVAGINSVQDWQEACSVSKHFIALSQYPSPEMCMQIADNGVPALVVLDNPLHSAAQLAVDLHSDISAVRAVSASASCLAEMLGQNEAVVQTSNTRNLSTFLVRLSELGGIDVDSRELTRVRGHAGELSRLGDVFSYRSEVPASTRNLHKLAGAALSQMGDGRVEWPASLFLLGDCPDMPMRGPIDLAGPARCLLYGPYMHLPSGFWDACMTVAITGNDGGQSFNVEVVCGGAIGGGRFHCQGSGSFEVVISFEHRNPHLPIELRVSSDSGAIYGSLIRFGVKLEMSK